MGLLLLHLLVEIVEPTDVELLGSLELDVAVDLLLELRPQRPPLSLQLRDLRLQNLLNVGR